MYSLLRMLLAERLGEFDAAAQHLRLALSSEGSHSATVSPVAITVGAEIDTERGRVEEAREALESLGLMSAPPEEVPFEQPLHARGRIRLALGQVERARDDFVACGRKNLERLAVGPAPMAWRSGAALACAALGDEDEARSWAGEELSLARAFGAPRTLGVSLRAAGTVAAPEDQIELLEESVEVLTASPARLERAKALVELGAALRRQGHRKDARAPLSAGLELAGDVGAVPLAQRGREELVATGARPRRTAQSGVDSLTPSERRVIRLAANGLSNRQIGRELVVTVKTVEMHLRNAYRKLEIGSREDLDGELRNAL